MSELVGSLELEFLINNPEFLAQLQQAESDVANSMLKIEASAESAGAAVASLVPKDAFSEATAGIDAFADSLQSFADTGNVALSGIDALLQQFNADLANGVITSEQYAEAITAMADAEAYFNQQVGLTNAQAEEEVGILQSLKATIAELKTEQFTITDPEELAASNLLLQEYEIELKAAANAGRVGFDEFGQKIVQTNAEIEEAVGLFGSLQAELKTLQAERVNIIDPAQISAANAQIQSLEAQIKNLSNQGKEGFDELGHALPVEQVGKFEAAIARSTNIQNIGARVVSQFTRQIVSLGVGFLSLEIGAKAIQSLISYIENLDAFTGRLDQAKQNMLAFQEVMKDADTSAGKQLGTLKELYDAATNVNNSIGDRIKAAQALREQDAATFANATALAIVNGDLKKSYDDLTLSIIAQAKSAAAASKIQALEGEKLDAQFQIDQNNYNKAAQIRQAQQDYQNNLKNPNQSFLAQGLTKQAQNPNGPNIVAPGTSINSALDLYKAEIAVINKQTNQLNIKPAQDLNVKTGVETFLEQYVKTISQKDTDLKNANKLLGDDLSNFDNLIGNVNDKTDLDNIKKALQAKLDSLTPTDAQYSKVKADLLKVDELEKQYSPKINDGKAAAAQDAESLKNKIALMQQLADAVDTVNRKGLNTDQQSLTAISDKFDQLRQKIAAFNADPKNANHNISGDVVIGLNTSENTAIDNQANLNENNYIQKDIDDKKKLYADYAAYREKVGKDIADADYSDLLKSGADYQTYLNTISKSIPENDISGPIQQRRQIILTAQQQELEDQKTSLEKLLESVKTYETEKAALQATYEDKRAQLVKAGLTAETAQLDQQYKEDLGKLNDSSFEKLTVVKELLSGVTDLSAQQAQTLIDTVTKDLDAAGGLTQDEIKKIKKALADAQLSIDNRVPDELIQIGSALSTIGKNFEPINNGVGILIGSLGSVVSSMGNVTKVSDKLQDDIKNGLSTTGDYVNLVSAGIQGIVGVIDTLVTASAARKQAAEDYYNSVIAFQNAYNVALDEQVKLQYQTDGNIFITNYSEELTDAAKAYNSAEQQYQQSLVALQQGQAIVAQKDVINAKNVASSAGSGALAGAAVGTLVGGPVGAVVGAVGGAIIGGLAGLFGGKTKENVLTPLLQQYPQLIQANGQFNESLAKTLIANNQVSDSTKVLLQNTINYYDEAQSAIDQINQALSSLSQNLGSNLETALVSAFENGTSAAQAFGDSVSDVISNIVSQFLFEDVFGSKFDDLNAKLKATVLAGGSSADITQDFTDFFQEAGPLVQEFQDGLSAAQSAGAADGLTLFPAGTGSSSTTLTGQIQGITAQQATELDGAINGLRLTNIEGNDILTANGKTMQDQLAEMRNQTLVQMQIAANTLRVANNSDQMVNSLVSIDSNTSSGNLTNALRAAGVV